MTLRLSQYSPRCSKLLSDTAWLIFPFSTLALRSHRYIRPDSISSADDPCILFPPSPAPRRICFIFPGLFFPRSLPLPRASSHGSSPGSAGAFLYFIPTPSRSPCCPSDTFRYASGSPNVLTYYRKSNDILFSQEQLSLSHIFVKNLFTSLCLP